MATPYAHILVLDDDIEHVTSLARPLQQWGWYHVHIVHTLPDAVDLLNKQPMDLLIVSISFALMAEFTLLNHLRKSLQMRHVSVIITAVPPDIPLIAKCISFGEIDFLTIPIEPTLLQHKVVTNLEKQQLLKQVLSSFAAFNAMKKATDDLKQIILPLGIKLSVEKDLGQLFQLVLSEAQSICHADMGILYLRTQDNHLRVVALRNESKEIDWRDTEGKNPIFERISLFQENGHPQRNTVSTVAITEQAANVSNVNALNIDFDLYPVDQFDQDNAYQTQSTLIVPLKSHNVLGVLQLINAQDASNKQTIPFTLYHQQVIESLASQAAIALQNHVLRERHEELQHFEQELQIGRQLQADFLPKDLPKLAGWELAARFQPAREVAGDFYDAFLMKNKKVGLVIADVCDKGMAAALFMALVRTLIRAFGQRNDYYASRDNVKVQDLDRAHAANYLAERPFVEEDINLLSETIGLTNYYINQTHRDTHMFATLFFGVLEPKSGRIIYINCGHPPPIIYRAVSKSFEFLEPTGPAIGLQSNVHFMINSTEINDGDILFAYTDGVTDARSPSGEMYNKERLLAQIITSSDSAKTLLTDIETAVQRHIGIAGQYDDITLLAAQRLNR
ncbi:MAG: SpoIIE family protein phosphatase [Chloroflexi bacterium]|nr:SpoIIE family protein phosphatase [Chloroflexota bacterium]